VCRHHPRLPRCPRSGHPPLPERLAARSAGQLGGGATVAGALQPGGGAASMPWMPGLILHGLPQPVIGARTQVVTGLLTGSDPFCWGWFGQGPGRSAASPLGAAAAREPRLPWTTMSLEQFRCPVPVADCAGAGADDFVPLVVGSGKGLFP